MFKEYRELVDLIESLETKKQALQLQIMEELDSEGVSNKETQYGHFFSSGRKVWKYSPSISSMQKSLLDAKHQEESDGTATLEKVTSYIRLVIPKE